MVIMIKSNNKLRQLSCHRLFTFKPLAWFLNGTTSLSIIESGPTMQFEN